ncbi:glycosyltransferase family 4 protein [Rhodobacteraceae bacterium R_SAG2]|nr:glycosyltransferase family 4 protein [Rhodobacteraceae bacterium R_SAG2]
MKILLITKTLNKGGAATGARNLLNALESAGAEVIALDAYSAQAGRPIGVLRRVERIYERLAHGAETHCLRIGPPVFDLRALVRTHRPHVVQLCDISGNTIGFEDLGGLPCPVVQRLSDFWPYHGARHYNETPPPHLGFADRLLGKTIFDGTNAPDQLVAPSNWLAGKLSADRVRVILNAVDPVQGLVARTGPLKPLRLGFISNPIHDHRKGVSSLARALSKLPTRTGTVQLHLFGEGSEATNLRVPGLEVIPHPAFRRDSVADVYSSFDILLCPSRLDNSPNVVTEALAHGVPVVAQSGTGMDSYVADPFGSLVDFHGGEPSCIASSIQNIAENYAEASSTALKYTSESLAPIEIGRKYLALYSDLLERYRS